MKRRDDGLFAGWVTWLRRWVRLLFLNPI